MNSFDAFLEVSTHLFSRVYQNEFTDLLSNACSDYILLYTIEYNVFQRRK